MLKRVTITGADSGTSTLALQDLSGEFPFVEWGILISATQEGSYRFPSRPWIDRLVKATDTTPMNLSTHICGRWVRAIMVGEIDWTHLPSVILPAQRIQINTHAQQHVSTMGLFESMDKFSSKEFIFQWDGVNNHLTHAAHAYGFRVSALYDMSGGAGILPKSWPKPTPDFPCGYAGGLSPENIKEEVAKIDAVCDKDYWIDMERNVRSFDDSVFDLQRVKQVLRTCKTIMEGESEHD